LHCLLRAELFVGFYALKLDMNKLKWYKNALLHLGFLPLVRMQLQKRVAKHNDFCRLTSKHLKHPVFARNGSSDLNVFFQIFVEREYSCLDYVEDAKLIFDLGANVGYSSAYFLSRYPGCTVLAVEPDPHNFAVLRKNVEPYGDRCITLQAAVWHCARPLRFKHAPSKGTEWARAVEIADVGEIVSVTIPQLLDTMPFPRISILKIDIEGAERELFDADANWLQSVENIVIELHDSACSDAFMRAIGPFRPKISRSGELTCCAL
jgi:FkbM family methyltransferase